MMSPSQRAKVDAAKLRAREERRLAQMGGVGPASYDPRRPGGTASGLCGSSAFRSSTPRISSGKNFGSDTLLRDVSLDLDPGAYNPDAGRNFAAASARTYYRRENASGQGSFGSKSARKMKQDIMGEEVPCPTNYGDEQKKGLAETGSKMPSASFNSNSRQRPKVRQADLPAPGAYTPTYNLVKPDSGNPMSSARSKSPKFPSGYSCAATGGHSLARRAPIPRTASGAAARTATSALRAPC